MDTRLCLHTNLRFVLCFISRQFIHLVKQLVNKMIYVIAMGLEPTTI